MSVRTFKVPGFEFAGIPCGIKGGGRLDLALIRSNPPATVVGAFTTNKVQAAPVLVSKKNIRSGRCSAVIINSGCANACTGKRGLRDAEGMVAGVAKRLGVSTREVLVCSTGKIGEYLPREKISNGIPKLVCSLSSKGLDRAARAVLTTDRGMKVAAESGRAGGKRFRIVGFVKGAGMIAPNLKQATMLAFLMTDLRLPRGLASRVFQRCLDRSFHRIIVDGDTSTNDTVLFLANGAAGNRPIQPGWRGEAAVERALGRVMERLARMIVEDGEGASKVVRIEIRRARTPTDAERTARAIATSPLVKTSFHGGDPNWGRVIAAAGRSGATLEPSRADIYYGPVRVVRRGVGAGEAAYRRARRVMKRGHFSVTLDLGIGRGAYSLWTSDLGFRYVKLNSHYRT